MPGATEAGPDCLAAHRPTTAFRLTTIPGLTDNPVVKDPGHRVKLAKDSIVTGALHGRATLHGSDRGMFRPMFRSVPTRKQGPQIENRPALESQDDDFIRAGQRELETGFRHRSIAFAEFEDATAIELLPAHHGFPVRGTLWTRTRQESAVKRLRDADLPIRADGAQS